jgi:hypothetical protein
LAPKSVKQLANQHGWRYVGSAYENAVILEFKKMADRILVNCDKRRVTTILFHDKFKGRFGATKLMREEVTDELLTSIFENPRVHTDKGRYLIKN